jgi:AcrR family transcriptional regulator
MPADATQHRARLNREKVLETAIALADKLGSDALSMRRLATELDVVPMALYKHVANKEQLLDGMVDSVIAEIERVPFAGDWRAAARQQVLAARAALQRHAWARRVIETRVGKSLAVLDYIEAFSGLLFAGGFSADLTHHAMHALGGRIWGFTQEVFEDAVPAPELPPEMMQQLALRYPNIVQLSRPHEDSVVGAGCDDQFEFEFALDLLLEGFDRLKQQDWSSRG